MVNSLRMGLDAVALLLAVAVSLCRADETAACYPLPHTNDSTLSVGEAAATTSTVTLYAPLDQALVRFANDTSSWKIPLTSPNATATIPASAYEIVWERDTTVIPKYLSGSGVLPPEGSTLTLMREPADGAFGLVMTLNLPGVPHAVFTGDYPDVLRLKLTNKFFNGSAACVYSANVATVMLHHVHDEFGYRTNRLFKGIGLLTTISSVMLGSSAATSPITIALMADMSCTRSAFRRGAENRRLLSFSAFDDTLAGVLHGSLMLAVVVPLVHGFVTWLVAHKFEVMDNPIVAMALTRCPSLTFGVLAILHPGICFVSIRFVSAYKDHPQEISFGVFGIIFMLACPLAFLLVAMRYIDGVFVIYEYNSTPEANRPSKAWQRILPRGRWELTEMRRAFGVMLAPYQKGNPLWGTFLFSAPSLVAILATGNPVTAAGCARQYGAISVMVAAYVAVVAYYRPYRCAVTNNLTVLTSVFVLFIGILATVQPLAPATNPAVFRYGTQITIIVVVIVLLCWVIHLVLVNWHEFKKCRKVELQPHIYRAAGDPISPFVSDGGRRILPDKFEAPATISPRRGDNDYDSPSQALMTKRKRGLSSSNRSRGDSGSPTVKANCNIINVATIQDDDVRRELKHRPDHTEMGHVTNPAAATPTSHHDSRGTTPISAGTFSNGSHQSGGWRYHEREDYHANHDRGDYDEENEGYVPPVVPAPSEEHQSTGGMSLTPPLTPQPHARESEEEEGQNVDEDTHSDTDKTPTRRRAASGIAKRSAAFQAVAASLPPLTPPTRSPVHKGSNMVASVHQDPSSPAPRPRRRSTPSRRGSSTPNRRRSSTHTSGSGKSSPLLPLVAPGNEEDGEAPPNLARRGTNAPPSPSQPVGVEPVEAQPLPPPAFEISESRNDQDEATREDDSHSDRDNSTASSLAKSAADIDSDADEAKENTAMNEEAVAQVAKEEERSPSPTVVFVSESNIATKDSNASSQETLLGSAQRLPFGDTRRRSLFDVPVFRDGKRASSGSNDVDKSGEDKPSHSFTSSMDQTASPIFTRRATRRRSMSCDFLFTSSPDHGTALPPHLAMLMKPSPPSFEHAAVPLEDSFAGIEMMTMRRKSTRNARRRSSLGLLLGDDSIVLGEGGRELMYPKSRQFAQQDAKPQRCHSMSL